MLEPKDYPGELADLGEKVAAPLHSALDRLDFNALRRAAQLLHGARLGLQSLGDDNRSWPSLASIALATRRSASTISGEIIRSGMDFTVYNFEASIRPALAPELLPDIDAFLVTETDMEAAIRAARESEESLGASNFADEYLRRLDEVRTVRVSDLLQGDIGDDSPNPGRGRRFRWAAACVRVVTGGLLIVANAAFGLGTVVVSGIPTMGLGTAVAAAAVVGSVVTGGQSLADGLKEMGGIADEVSPA